MKPNKPLSKEEVRRHLEPYAVEIGLLTLAWNDLHDHLGQIFWGAITPQGGISVAIWNKLSNDRTQRDLLRTAIEAGALLGRPNADRAIADALWLIKKVDSLAEGRNNAIHAPLTTLTDIRDGTTTVAPQDHFGNRRAKNLAAKTDLLAELGWYRECAEILSDFSVDLTACISFPGAGWPWPDTPSLPPQPNQKKDGPHPGGRSRPK